MITASADFITAVAGNARHFDAKIIYEGSAVSCDIQNITTKKGAQDGQTLSIGSVFSSSAEIVCSGLSVPLENEDIELQIGIMTGPDTYDYITFAQYTVIQAQKTRYQTVLTCAGFISSKFNVMLPALGSSPTIQAIADGIQTATGVSVSLPVEADSPIEGSLDGADCRSALAIVAFLLGGYATENASGGVEIRQYTLPEERQPVLAENCIAPPIVAEQPFEMTGVKVIVQEEVYILTSDTTVVAGKTYYVQTGIGTEDDPILYEPVAAPSGNPLAQGWYELGEVAFSSGSPIRQIYSSPYMTQEIFESFAEAVVGLTYMPAEIDMTLGDPRFEPWDCMTVTDTDGETTYTVPCHMIESTFDGGFASEIRAIGENESEVSGSLTKKINETVEQLAVAQLSADQARTAAKIAQESADRSQELLGEMEDAAEAAGTTLTQIYQDAENAGQAAANAQDAAIDANASANSALNQLSEVERVLDVLSWAAEHGEYAETSDTEVAEGKYYFEPIEPTAETAFAALADENDAELEDENDDIILGFNQYEFAVVMPGGDEDPQAMGWYELVGVDDAISNYVSSHLALDSSGLWLQTDGVGSKVLLSALEGLVLYGSNGRPMAKYGESAVIGDENGFHIEISDQEIGFYQVAQKVAYINGNRLYITQSVVLQQIDVGTPVADGGLGQWSWCVHPINGKNNLYLKWLG